MVMKPEEPEETDDEVTDHGRDSCADLDTLPPGVFFRKFGARIKDGSQWLNARTRLWFEEAKRRIWPYLREHGLEIKSSALKLKDGEAKIRITFLKKDFNKVRLPSFFLIEEGQSGPFVHAWASIRELGAVFKKRHAEKLIEEAKKRREHELEEAKRRKEHEFDETMGNISQEIGRIVEDAENLKCNGGLFTRIVAARKSIEATLKKIRGGGNVPDKSGEKEEGK
jgi:hypothetical protein